MALKPCRECGRQVSTHAFACPDCGAPVEALPVAMGCARGLRPVPARRTRPSTRLLVLVTVTMALAGAAADAGVRHIGASRTRTARAPVQPARSASQGGIVRRLIGRLTGTMGALGSDPAGRQAELDMRFDLGEIANRQVVEFGAHGAYAKTVEALGLAPRPGVHVNLTGGDGSWSATATHDRLPGVTCRAGAGAGEPRPGQIICDRQ